MPRARNPNRDKARELWLDSGKTRSLKSIAEELGESPSRIRKWKAEDKWDGSAKKERSDSAKGAKGSAKKRKGGPPPGTRNNPEGRGTEPGNTKALKHGAYSKVMLGLMDEDEQAAMQDGATGQDAESDLQDALREINARIVRLTKFVAKLKQQIKDDEDLRTMTTSETCEGEGKMNYTSSSAMKCDAITGLIKLESELDKAYGRKTKVLEALEKLRMDRRKADADEKQDTASAWLEAVEGMNADDVL